MNVSMMMSREDQKPGHEKQVCPLEVQLLKFYLWFQSAKMFNYAGWRKTCNFIFTVFAAVFIITRLVILPFW